MKTNSFTLSTKPITIVHTFRSQFSLRLLFNSISAQSLKLCSCKNHHFSSCAHAEVKQEVSSKEEVGLKGLLVLWAVPKSNAFKSFSLWALLPYPQLSPSSLAAFYELWLGSKVKVIPKICTCSGFSHLSQQ